MRILFFSSIFPRPSAPTRGIYCQHLCRALAEGHDVTAIAPVSWLERRVADGRGGQLTSADGFDVHYPTFYYVPKILRALRGPMMWASSSRTIREVGAAFRPDCILSYWLHPDGEVAVRAGRLLGIPVIVRTGGSDMLVLTRNRARRNRILRVLRAADGIVTAGSDLKSKVIEAGIPERKVHVVRTGIDQSLFSPGPQEDARARLGIPHGCRVLLSVGNLSPVKGHSVLLEATARLQGNGAAFRLYLVGDGPLRAELEEFVRSRGLGECVHFAGMVAQRELPDWYRAADLTVLPSLSEGVPNVLRESLACGTPFVASRVGGVGELAAETQRLTESCARLVPAGDPVALAEAIGEALSSERPQVPAGLRFGSWSDSAEALLRVLRPLVSRPAAAGAPAAALEK